MTTRNLTLNLPKDLIRQVKIHAAEHDTTVNAFVRELLQDVMSRRTRTWDVAERLLSLADQGLCFRADLRAIHRDEIHDRR